MVIHVKWIAETSGSEGPRDRDSVRTYEAWEDDPEIWNTEDETAFDNMINALGDAVAARAPVVSRKLWRDRINWRFDQSTENHYLFDVQYSFHPPELTRRWSFDTTGGTVKLTTSNATTSYAAPGRVAPNFNKAIEVRNNEVQGVDIIIPALKLTCTYRHRMRSLPLVPDPVNDANIDEYIRFLARASGRTNNGNWLTYKRGEMLFIGATGEYVPGMPMELQYHFVCSENATLADGTALTIGDIINIEKRGHQYLWVLFEGSNDPAASNAIVQKPLSCYVETVYREFDFNLLQIHA